MTLERKEAEAVFRAVKKGHDVDFVSKGTEIYFSIMFGGPKPIICINEAGVDESHIFNPDLTIMDDTGLFLAYDSSPGRATFRFIPAMKEAFP